MRNPMEENRCLQNKYYLKPGELFAGSKPARVTTVVGSCVAVTMYHQQMNMAVMCHAMQPSCSHESSDCRNTCSEKFKVVRCVITEMMAQFEQLGVPKEGIEVKLFGGSAQFAKNGGFSEERAIGRQNIEAALNILSTYGIRAHVMEVGGGMGRKLIFDTNNGAVFLKRIGPLGAKKN